MSERFTTLEALQLALNGEYAAVYGYGQYAGRLSGAELRRARADLDAHRSRRDRLRSQVLDQDATPAAEPPSFATPNASTAGAARRELAAIENRLTAVYGDLVEASDGATRALAITAMTESAVRSARWGGAVPDFPGLPERAATPTADAGSPGSPTAP